MQIRVLTDHNVNQIARQIAAEVDPILNYISVSPIPVIANSESYWAFELNLRMYAARPGYAVIDVDTYIMRAKRNIMSHPQGWVHLGAPIPWRYPLEVRPMISSLE